LLIFERIQFLLRRLLDFERLFSHASECVSGGLRGIAQTECPFPSGAIRIQAVPEVLPDGRVFLQVDQNTDLAALVIRDELYSGQGSIVLQVAAGQQGTALLHV
jgi:hypothetical protein